MPAETSLAICSMIFGGIFERLPRLRVAFAHGGGSFPATFGRIEHGFRVRPDLVAVDNPESPRKYLKQFWLDSLVHDPVMLDYLVRFMGPERDGWRRPDGRRPGTPAADLSDGVEPSGYFRNCDRYPA